MASTAVKTNTNHVQDNQDDRRKKHFNWTDKKIELLLENIKERIKVSLFFVPFRVSHTQRNAYQNRSTFFVYLGFLLRTFFIHRTAGQEECYFFSPLYHFHPLHRQFRLQPSDYCRELNSAHCEQLDANWEPLVSELKSPTTKLRAHEAPLF